MERTNLYLTEEQQRRLASRARTEGVTKSAVVRRILDEALAITTSTPSVEDALAESVGIWSDRSNAQLAEVLEWRQEIPFDGLTG